MALLRPYDQTTKTEPAVEPASLSTPTPKAAVAPKNRPTPTRKEAEAARMAAVHPKLTRKQVRQADAAIERANQAKRLEAVENAPERVLMRNFVDARWTILEGMMGMMALLVIAMLLSAVPQLAVLLVVVTVLLYLFLAAGLITYFVNWQAFKRELASRYPNASSRGLAFAMLSRMMAFRRMRQPKPTINRGDPY